MTTEERVAKAVDIIIEDSNRLYEISKDPNVAPIEAGRAKWRRQGMLDAILVLSQQTNLFDFKDLFDTKS